MYSVPIAGERLPVPIDRLHYDNRLPGWACSWSYGDRQIEVRIGGDDEALDGRVLELAELVLPHLEALEAVANAYLRSFFEHSDEFQGPWTLQKLRLDMPPPWEGRATTFDVRLATRCDDYGEWGVGFRRHSYPSPNHLAAESFCRKQW